MNRAFVSTHAIPPAQLYPGFSVVGAAKALAFLILIVSGLIDLPRDISFGPVTGQAVLTVAYFLAGSAPFLMVPARGALIPPRHVALGLFLFWAIVSLAWTNTISNGTQNILVIGTFWMMLLLGDVTTAIDPGFARWLERCLLWSVAVGVTIYCTSLVLFGPGADDIVSARNFGLFGLFGVAHQLGRWRYGAWSGLVWAAIFTLLIGASESRLALGIAVVLFPLAQTPTHKLARVLKMLAVLCAAVALSYVAFMYFDALRDRFVTGDVSITIGSVSINGSGRSAFWRLTADAIRDSFIVGHGAGSAGELIDSVYGGIHHPHNDYLRILHDYGIVGMILWVTGIGTLFTMLWRNWRICDEVSASAARQQLTALLLLVAFAMEMTAENAMVYVFVTAPVGLMVGSALGSHRRVKALLQKRELHEIKLAQQLRAQCPQY